MHQQFACTNAPGKQGIPKVKCAECKHVMLRRNFTRHARIHGSEAAMEAVLARLEDVDEPLNENVLEEMALEEEEVEAATGNE